MLIGTCSFWNQPLEAMASEVEAGFRACQERKYNALRSTLVLKDAPVLSGMPRRKVTPASFALSWPRMLCPAFPVPSQADG